MPMIQKCTWINLKPYNKWDDILSSVEVECIGIWMNSNVLKLNNNKTEYIVFSSKQHVKKTENLHIKIGSSYINLSMSIRNLGNILDNTLGIEKQVNSISKSCYYQIRNIGLIHKYINDKSCKT